MTREDQLAELLERWEDTLSQGNTVTPEDLCHDCPNLAADFRALLAQMGAVNAVLTGNGATVSLDELAARVEGGRYRPLSFHDQGGLGVVFVAEDAELHRNVALKCMQELASYDAEARRRFLLEAEITAKLEHPGVVPIYGLGRDGHGKPYYAMRFVHGGTLASAIQRYHANAAQLDPGERHVEMQRLLRRFVSVCETMAYAHARGVIHRDLKPSNIMLGAYGETLVVDWGLAKRLEQAEKNDDPALAPLRLRLQDGGRTMLGEVRGSPVYMSPEQARGEWECVGPLSDVYSLGATLYVLLTGQKPYEDRSAQEIIDKVKRGVCPPPGHIHPDVPPPLDAICRRAMHPDPAARYAGAAELARDLERWLADEPVAAWTEPLALRVRRWLRRHQTVAAAAAASVVVALVVLGITGWRLDQQNRELERLNRQLALAKLTLEQANIQLDLDKADVEKKNVELTDRSRGMEQKNIELGRELAKVEWQHGHKDISIRRLEESFQTFQALAERQPQRVARASVEEIPLALATASAERAKELDRAKPNEREEQLRRIAAALDALTWMEQTLADRNEEPTANTRAAAVALRKQLEELRKD